MPLAPLAQKTTRARKEHHHGGPCHRQRAAPRPSCSPFPGLSSILARARLRNTGCVSAARTPSPFAAPCTPPPGPCRPPIGCRTPLRPNGRTPSAPAGVSGPRAFLRSASPAGLRPRSLPQPAQWPERGQRRCGALLRAAARRRSCLARVYLLKLYRLHRCTGGTARAERPGRLSPRASCPATAHSSRST